MNTSPITVRRTPVLAGLCGLLVAAACAGAQTSVWSADFDSSIPGQITPGVATIAGVQRFAGLGPTGNQFGGGFLRSPTGNLVTLTLTDLPPHDALNIEFLFAAIDSLDGTGSYPSGDFFRVTIDGVQIFRESFANATEQQIQSYVPPPGVQLARRVDLGFSGPGSYYTDSAYNLGADPVFQQVAHSGPTATITFLMEGPGIQSLDDESWAMDNLRIILPCTAPTCDFNQDGGADNSDVTDLADSIASATDPFGCGSDFNQDGGADNSDVTDLANAIASGACP